MQRQTIYAALLERSSHGKLKKDTTKIVAEMFNVSRRAVQRVWRRVKECRANGVPVDVRSRKPKNCGCKKVQIDLSEVARIPLHRRGTIRHLAEATGYARSTLHRWFKEGMLRRHSNSLKPLLKEKTKKDKLR
jgi:transposase